MKRENIKKNFVAERVVSEHPFYGGIKEITRLCKINKVLGDEEEDYDF